MSYLSPVSCVVNKALSYIEENCDERKVNFGVINLLSGKFPRQFQIIYLKKTGHSFLEPIDEAYQNA